MLTRENTEILIEFLCGDNRFAYTKDDFISDEENIGYPNVYWRCVRAGSPTDVDQYTRMSGFGHSDMEPFLPVIRE